MVAFLVIRNPPVIKVGFLVHFLLEAPKTRSIIHLKARYPIKIVEVVVASLAIRDPKMVEVAFLGHRAM